MAERRREFGDRQQRYQPAPPPPSSSDRYYNNGGNIANAGPANRAEMAPENRQRPFDWNARQSSVSTLSSFGTLSIDGSLAGTQRSMNNNNQYQQQEQHHHYSMNNGGGSDNIGWPSCPPTPPMPPQPLFPRGNNPSFGHPQAQNDFGDDDGFRQQQLQQKFDPNNRYNSLYNVPQSTPCSSYSMPNLASQGRAYPAPDPVQQTERRRRHKFILATKPDVELFNERNHIQPGDYWDEMFGQAKDNNLAVSCLEGGTQMKQLIQHFEECNFSIEIMRNIQLRKFRAPTQVQKSVIPVIQKGRHDVMAHAQTGTGKSAAFLLPIISEVQQLRMRLPPATRGPNRDSPYALIIVPTKELAEQLYVDGRSFAISHSLLITMSNLYNLVSFCEDTGVSVQRTYGDTYVRESKQNLQSGCDICVFTCGRLLHFIREGVIKLDNLRYLVLDEADKLLKCEHFLQCVEEVKQHPAINPNHRVLMFSATFDTAVQVVAQKILRQGFIFVNVGALNSAVETIVQEFIEVCKYEKQNMLFDILKKDATFKLLVGGSKYCQPAKKTLVFVEQKRQSDRLAIALTQEKYRAASLNSDRTLEQRTKAVTKFTHGDVDVLVSTDVAARGLNFPNVQHVINYDLPERMDDKMIYIHRIGRTGRAGNSGLATSFFDPTSPDDTAMATFYIEVLRQASMVLPEFLRKYAPGEYAGGGRPSSSTSDLATTPTSVFGNDNLDNRHRSSPWDDLPNNVRQDQHVQRQQRQDVVYGTQTQHGQQRTQPTMANARHTQMARGHGTAANAANDDSFDLFSVADSDVWSRSGPDLL